MATRLPQVRVGGKNRQMPAGDAVPVAAGGTGATSAAAALAALGGVPMAITGTLAKTDLMSDAPVGRWVSYLTVTGGGTDWPTALTVGYWNVFTFGVASRTTQIAQEAFQTGVEVGGLFVRAKHDSTWTPWKRLASHAEAVASVAAGVMDCAIANTFSAAISANTTLAFSNIPSGAYSCVLEINHTGGAITMPSGTVWVGGTPIFTAGTRHLIFFQRATLGTAGWYASALAGFPA